MSYANERNMTDLFDDSIRVYTSDREGAIAIAFTETSRRSASTSMELSTDGALKFVGLILKTIRAAEKAES